MNLYQAVPPETDYSTIFKKEHIGSYGDMEWHTTSHPEEPIFYSSPNTLWYVTGVAGSVAVNELVCVYSRMQGIRKCDTVMSTSVSVKYDSFPTVYNLVKMKNNYIVGGDSGGPWSSGSKAYGIQSGYMTHSDGSQHSLWSRASYFPQALGVTVKIHSST
jgi:streptogrisin C